MMCMHNENTDSATLQNRLTGALISLARVTDGNEHLITRSSTEIIVEGLAATASNANCGDFFLKALLERVTDEKRRMVPDCFTCACPCGKNNDYDMTRLWSSPYDIRHLKSQLLLGIREIAACIHSESGSFHQDEAILLFLYKALIVLGMDDWGTEELMPVIAELNLLKQSCMIIPG